MVILEILYKDKPEELNKLKEEIRKLEEEHKKIWRDTKLKSIDKMIDEIKEKYIQDIESLNPKTEELAQYQLFIKKNDIKGSEYFFLPEEWLYQYLLKYIKKTDIIFDIGAGDLRFDLLLCKYVNHVYAIEIDPYIIKSSLDIINYSKPTNLSIIIGNGFTYPVPKNITLIICLMMHRNHDFSKDQLKNKIIYASSKGLNFHNFSKRELKKLKQ